MSSAGQTFGTSSPPLEATGNNSEQPMGVSNIEGDHPKGVPDKQQRGGYFKESGGAEHLGETGQAQKGEKIKQD